MIPIDRTHSHSNTGKSDSVQELVQLKLRYPLPDHNVLNFPKQFNFSNGNLISTCLRCFLLFWHMPAIIKVKMTRWVDDFN